MMCTIDVKNRLYVIGGLDLMEDTYKDIWCIKLKTFNELMDGIIPEAGNLWESVKTLGEGPEKISNHRAVLIESKIYVYGGLINNDNSKDSLFWFDITNSLWINHRTKVILAF